MKKAPLRETAYATELARGTVRFSGGSEGRLERLRFKEGPAAGTEGYRFSWWKEGRMIPRPLDVTEEELLDLVREAVQEGVFTTQALTKWRKTLR
jgi:hypothetical protein